MANVTTRDSGSSVVGELLVLQDGQSRVELAPHRGGTVTSFSVAGRELIYLERNTLEDASKNVRGGIPVLFPTPGKLPDDRYTRDGHSGSLKQHGFARNLPWSYTIHQGASVTLRLTSSELTRAQFPWDFRYDITYSLVGAALTLELAIENTGRVTLPCAFGFHPYFNVDDKQHARIDTEATRAWDNVGKRFVAFEGFDLTLPEVDTYLLDHGSSASALHLADGSRITLRGSADFTRWVVWTVQGKGYVCLEPWSSELNAINTGVGLTEIPPGQTHRASVELAWHA